MRFCLLLCALLVLDSCQDKPPRVPTEGELPPHILSHTSGVISRGAEVVVTFDSLYRPVQGEVPAISFSPAVNGESMLNGQQLVFRPAGFFTSGTEYVATVEVPDQEDYAFGSAFRSAACPSKPTTTSYPMQANPSGWRSPAG